MSCLVMYWDLKNYSFYCWFIKRKAKNRLNLEKFILFTEVRAASAEIVALSILGFWQTLISIISKWFWDYNNLKVRFYYISTILEALLIFWCGANSLTVIFLAGRIFTCTAQANWRHKLHGGVSNMARVSWSLFLIGSKMTHFRWT